MHPDCRLIVTFTEGEFCEVKIQPSLDRAFGWAAGFVDGANAYGAGSAGAYVLPIGLEDMRRTESPAEFDRAMDRVLAVELEAKRP